MTKNRGGVAVSRRGDPKVEPEGFRRADGWVLGDGVPDGRIRNGWRRFAGHRRSTSSASIQSSTGGEQAPFRGAFGDREQLRDIRDGPLFDVMRTRIARLSGSRRRNARRTRSISETLSSKARARLGRSKPAGIWSTATSRTFTRRRVRSALRQAFTAICHSQASNRSCSRSRGSSRHARRHASCTASEASPSLDRIEAVRRNRRPRRGRMSASNAARSPCWARVTKPDSVRFTVWAAVTITCRPIRVAVLISSSTSEPGLRFARFRRSVRLIRTIAHRTLETHSVSAQWVTCVPRPSCRKRSVGRWRR